MEAVKQIIEQLEEAKAFIKRDTDSCYRIALILIDNCVELMLKAAIDRLLSRNDMHSRLNAQLRELFTPEQLKEKGIELQEVPSSRIKKIRRFFPPKIDYLQNNSFISVKRGNCLKHLHNYRNTSYHHNVQNRDTLYAITLLYYRLATFCLSKYRPKYLSSEGVKSEKYFLRYGIDKYWDLSNNGMNIIAESLSSDTVLQNQYFVSLLTKSVDAYIGRVNEALSFLIENTDTKDAKKHYKVASHYIVHSSHPDTTSNEYRKYKSHIGPTTLKSWSSETKKWKGCTDNEIVYLKYVQLEKAITPIVDAFEAMASDLDNAIQIQIDIARGK